MTHKYMKNVPTDPAEVLSCSQNSTGPANKRAEQRAGEEAMEAPPTGNMGFPCLSRKSSPPSWPGRKENKVMAEAWWALLEVVLNQF